MNNSSCYSAKKAIKNSAISVLRMIFLICICFVVLYPLFLKVSISFMSVSDLYDSSVVFLPKNWTLSNWKLSLDVVDYFPNLLKSVGYCTMIAALQIIAGLLVGYGFGRFNFPFKNIIFAFVMLTLVVPAENIMLPLYFYFHNMKILDTAWPNILLSVTGCGLRGGFYIFMMKSYFQGIPKELEEAGSIDGAGSFTIFYRIILPSATSITVTCFLFSFAWQWTDTFYSSTFMPSNTLLQTKIEGLANLIGAMMSTTPGGVDPYYQSIITNTGIVLLILPITLVFLFAQRFFVESIENSGIVG